MTADLSRPSARRPPGYRHRRRTTAAVLLALGFILSAIALGTGWWSVSGGGVNIYYTPGNSFSCSGAGCPTTLTYSVISSQMANLYSAIDYMIIVVVILAIIATAFAFLGAYGVTFGRGQLSLIVLLSVVAGVLSVAPVIYAALGQPAAFQAANGGCNGPSYCTSFFYGSYGTGASTFSYGPFVGWYAALVGFVFLIAGGALYSRTRTEPFTMDELAASAQLPVPGMVPGAPGGASPWAQPPAPAWPPPPPTPQPGWPPVQQGSAPPITCPRCGMTNASTATSCWRCQSPLR
ncbi:MAG TPA: hypothetical protein VMV28_06650 [Thermoplasmata archaeon]|nr:hypothetical protein [Thermoplasmata archaeon]